MGLLDNVNLDDPKTQFLLNAAMGLLAHNPNQRANFGNDVSRGGIMGMQGYQNAQQWQQKLAQDKLQQQLMNQQLSLGGINLQTAQQNFADEQQARGILKSRFPGQQQEPQQLSGPGMDQQQGPQQLPPLPQQAPPQLPQQGGLPSTVPFGKGFAVAPAAAGNGKFDTFNKYNSLADQFESQGLMKQAQQYRDMAEKFRPELKDEQVRLQGGKPVIVRNYKDGTTEVSQFDPTAKTQYVNAGGAHIGVDEYTGQPNGNQIKSTMTPGEIASNAIARQNLVYRQMEVDPFGMLGTPQVPGVGGAPVAPGGGAPGAAPRPGMNLPGVGPDTHGEEFLKALPPQVANQVKALAEGRQSFPSGMALRHPAMQQLIGLVSQYDPSFDAVNYAARAAVRKDFTSGKSAENLKALNTAVAHLESLSGAMDSLNNFGGITTPLNYPVNATQKFFGDPRQKEVELKTEAVANELAKVFRSSGMSQGEITRWTSAISPNMSPAQKQAVIKSALDLMEGRIAALGDTYGKGMGTTSDGLQLLSSSAQQAFNKLRGGGQGGSTPDLKAIEDEILRRRRGQ